MNAAYLIIGIVLLVVAVTEAIWTSLWSDGSAGPLTSRLTTALWRLWRALFERRGHGALSLAGPLVLVVIASSWMLMLWAGWTLVYASDNNALQSTIAGQGVTWTGRIWAVAYTLFTVGNGDFAPSVGSWQLVSSLIAVSGFSIATLTITYLLSVLSAVVQKRSFAGQVNGLGDTAAELVIEAWNGQKFGALEIQLNSLATQLGTLTQQHLAYPVLHYYHAAAAWKSSAVAIAILDEALSLLQYGVQEDARPDAAVLRSARRTVRSYLDTLASAFINPAEDLPSSPQLQRLRSAGIPTVDDATFSEAMRGQAERRRLLLGMIRNDAWEWPPT